MPAWSTDWNGVATPSLNPWLVTAVSVRSVTGVSEARKGLTCAGGTSMAVAHACAFAGFVSR